MNHRNNGRTSRTGGGLRSLLLLAGICLMWFPQHATDIHAQTLILPPAGSAPLPPVNAPRDLHAPPMTPLGLEGIYDPEGEALDTTLQEPAVAMQDFPVDRRGEIDWVRTLETGLISPRKSVTGDPWEEAIMRPMDFDILFTNTAQMPHVRFPHRQHTEWLTCSNCHFDIFIPQKGSNPVDMTRILKGEFCGRCHDKVAFPLWVCERCHSVPHEDSPPRWW